MLVILCVISSDLLNGSQQLILSLAPFIDEETDNRLMTMQLKVHDPTLLCIFNTIELKEWVLVGGKGGVILLVPIFSFVQKCEGRNHCLIFYWISCFTD